MFTKQYGSVLPPIIVPQYPPSSEFPPYNFHRVYNYYFSLQFSPRSEFPPYNFHRDYNYYFSLQLSPRSEFSPYNFHRVYNYYFSLQLSPLSEFPPYNFHRDYNYHRVNFHYVKCGVIVKSYLVSCHHVTLDYCKSDRGDNCKLN